MAQKIFPRSLRNPNKLSTDFSFYSEKPYATILAKSYKITNALYDFCKKNNVSKNKPKVGPNKRPNKKKKIHSFIQTHFFISNILGALKVSPILFKFANRSLAKKYNPIITVRRGHRVSMAHQFRKKAFIQKQKLKRKLSLLVSS